MIEPSYARGFQFIASNLKKRSFVVILTDLIDKHSSKELINSLKDGTIDALVAQDPFRIGYEAVKSLADKLNGKTPPKVMDLSARVITRADLDKPDVHAMLFPDLKKYLD